MAQQASRLKKKKTRQGTATFGLDWSMTCSVRVGRAVKRAFENPGRRTANPEICQPFNGWWGVLRGLFRVTLLGKSGGRRVDMI